MTRMSTIRVLVVTSVIAVLTGCGSSNNTLAPQFQPEVANNPDSFQFQATGVTNVTQNLSYNWLNSGTTANIDQSCAITQGSARIQIRDNQGTLVYDSTLDVGGTFVTSAGATGTWTIRVILNGVDGTLNFRAQKAA
jgi:outer membrane biogenesis lipoprotein LolB